MSYKNGSCELSGGELRVNKEVVICRDFTRLRSVYVHRVTLKNSRTQRSVPRFGFEFDYIPGSNISDSSPPRFFICLSNKCVLIIMNLWLISQLVNAGLLKHSNPPAWKHPWHLWTAGVCLAASSLLHSSWERRMRRIQSAFIQEHSFTL